MFISNGANAGFVQLRDPLFGISMLLMFWIVGVAAFGIGLTCLFSNQTWLKLGLLLWFALIFWTYRVGLLCVAGSHSFNGYWGNFAEAFHISPITADLIFKIAFLYMLIGSSTLLVRFWSQKSAEAQIGYLKMACPSCGGKIKFQSANMGQDIACPHCQLAVTLQGATNLKMKCVLCGGHIEFPAHAIGQKIPCPHCTKIITLLRPI